MTTKCKFKTKHLNIKTLLNINNIKVIKVEIRNCGAEINK